MHGKLSCCPVRDDAFGAGASSAHPSQNQPGSSRQLSTLASDPGFALIGRKPIRQDQPLTGLHSLRHGLLPGGDTGGDMATVHSSTLLVARFQRGDAGVEFNGLIARRWVSRIPAKACHSSGDNAPSSTAAIIAARAAMPPAPPCPSSPATDGAAGYPPRACRLLWRP